MNSPSVVDTGRPENACAFCAQWNAEKSVAPSPPKITGIGSSSARVAQFSEPTAQCSDE